jgi:hypothetical protein
LEAEEKVKGLGEEVNSLQNELAEVRKRGEQLEADKDK